MADTSRRSFFTQLLREIVQVKTELEQELRGHFEEALAPPPEPAPRARPVPATFTDEELVALARELGLERRVDEVLRIVRRGLRLTRAAASAGEGARSHLGGVPDLPRELAWPDRDGVPLLFLGQLRLDEVAALEPGLPVPAAGLLSVFWDGREQPTGLESEHADAVRVLHLPDADALEPRPAPADELPELPLELSRELTVPGEWSPFVEPLGLEPEELDAWSALRERVDERQGYREDDPGREMQALHRLLGHADDMWGDPEREAARVAGAEEEEWRLLLQVSADADLRTPWGVDWSGGGKLYVVAPLADLAGGRFDRARAILQAW